MSAAGFDAIVIGGSYAGLSAALQLARARRRVLVIDAGLRRNRFARTSHGFLGQDGRAPGDIVADARTQLLAYPDAQWLEGAANHAAQDGDGFVVQVATGQRMHGRRLVLATGVVDELPDVEGLAERWGTHVFHCPYCHGYELAQGRIGVLAVGEVSQHHAMLLPDWGSVTFFLNEAFAPDEDQLAALAARGVTVERRRIARLVDAASVELADGSRIELDGLFTASGIRMASPIAGHLGCAFDEGPLGAFIRVNEFKETTIPGVFACGDAARMAGSVALAVGDGAMAGAATHQSLVFRA